MLFNRSLLIIVVAIISIVIAALFSKETEGVCTNDPLIHFNAADLDSDKSGSQEVKFIDPCTVFSEEYKEARTKFREAANEVHAELVTLPIVDEDYTIDIAILKGDLPGLVLHSSATHGVEGYAGSAIQISFLKYIAPELLLMDTTGTNKKKEYPTIVLIHAINPWGMSHFRRTNENNVDLNRNGIPEHEWSSSVLTRDPNYANYEDFNEKLFNPRRPPSRYDKTVGVFMQAIQSILKHGFIPMKRAMVTGQYHYDKGVFFGGKELQPSHKVLCKFLKESLLPSLSTKDDSGSPRTVTWVDVHTGLGKSGTDTLFSPTDVPTEDMESTFPGALLDDTEVTSGYDMAVGLNRHFYDEIFSSPTFSKPWIILEEFGTVPSIMVARALVLENMARHYLPLEDQNHWTTLTRSAFYQRTPTWRKSIVTRGLKVLLQSMERSSH